MGNLLPSSVLKSKKRGFSLPLSLWMRGRLREMIEDLIGYNALRSSQYVKPEFYNTYVKPMLCGDNSNISLIWTVFMFELWNSIQKDT